MGCGRRHLSDLRPELERLETGALEWAKVRALVLPISVCTATFKLSSRQRQHGWKKGLGCYLPVGSLVEKPR